MTISRVAPFVLALAMAASLAAQSPSVTWHDRAFDQTLADAKASSRPVLVYFWMDGSQHCADLWNQTLATPEANQVLPAFVCHSAKATDQAGRDLIQRFHVTTLPSLVFVRADGALDDAVFGFIPLGTFQSELQRVLAGSQTVSALRAAADADPDDLTKRFALAQKLGFVGDRKAAEALLDSIRRDDPQGATAPGAEVLLFDIRKRILDAAEQKADPSTWDLTPMYRALKKARQPAVRFKGYSWLADTQGKLGDRKKQREAWRAAWPDAPAAQAAEWGGDVLLGYWNQREDALAGKDRQLARDIAKHILDAVEGDDSEATAEARAFQLRCAACGLAVAGKLTQARKIIARAITLQPNDGELTALSDQLAK